MQIEVVTEKGIPLLFVAVEEISKEITTKGVFTEYKFLDEVKYSDSCEYEILCFDDEMTEEMAKTLVDDCPYFAKCWKHYCPTGRVGEKPIIYDSTVTCWTSLESYQSLKRANNIDPSKNWIVLKIEKR